MGLRQMKNGPELDQLGSAQSRGARSQRTSATANMACGGNGKALHIETSNLHVELCAALKEDVCRKKTDDMKKRAIHLASSYDEFRHMVSCAHLTPVTRKEMETLSDQKRGWQGRSGGCASTTKKFGCVGRGGRRSTRKSVSARDTPSGAAKTDPLRVPEDRAHFQRDWRRQCRTYGERLEYLRLIGPEKLSSLFRVEMEPDILAQVLSVICRNYRSPRIHRDDGTAPSSPAHDPPPGEGINLSGSERGISSISNEDASQHGTDVEECVEWLWALTKTGRFSVNVMFLEDEAKLALGSVFHLITVSFGDQHEDVRRLQSLRQAYAV